MTYDPTISDHSSTLYDADGNAIAVRLVRGEYRLVVTDPTVASKLDEAILWLSKIHDILEQRLPS
jgi:hypothetical protein